jgi:hypothetical protein
MKKMTLLSVGIIPFFIGYGMNYLMLDPFFYMVLPYELIGIAFLIVWFFVGRYSYKLVGTRKAATILGNSIAFIVLLLIIYQEYIHGQYWMNQVGLATQFYYLPLISLAFIFTRMFHTMPPSYIAAFLMMCIVFYLGCHTSKHYIK